MVVDNAVSQLLQFKNSSLATQSNMIKISTTFPLSFRDISKLKRFLYKNQYRRAPTFGDAFPLSLRFNFEIFIAHLLHGRLIAI